MRFLLFFFFAPAALVAQKYADTLLPPGKDTVVVREYDKHGRLYKTTAWTGDQFTFPPGYMSVGEVATQWDTLDVIQHDTVLVSRYGKNGKLRSQTLENEEMQFRYRQYYYADTVWGYWENDPRVQGNVYYLREYYLDSMNRIISRRDGKMILDSNLTFYRNGNPQCICFYVNGKREGLQRVFHENGNPSYVGTYANGLENGVISEYYENGKPESVYKMTNGTRQDTSFEYHENGQLRTRIVYKDGKAMEVLDAFDEQGKPRAVGTLKNGTGTILNYNDDGSLYSIDYYENGKKVKTKKAKKR